MTSHRPAVHAILIAVLVCASPWPAIAQDMPGIASHVPGQSVAAVSLWPKQMAAGPRMQMLPLEVLSAAGLENVGVDPLQLDRVDILIGLPNPVGPQFGALLESSQDLEIQNLQPDILDGNGLIDEGGFKYVQVLGPNQLIIHQLQPRVAIFGTKDFVKQMVQAADREALIAQILASVSSQQDALAIVSIAKLRPMLQGLADGATLPPAVANDLEILLGETEFASLRVLVSAEEKLQLVFSSQDEAGARDTLGSLKNLISFAHAQIVAELKQQIPNDSQTGQAFLKYIDRMGVVTSSVLQPQQIANRVVLEVENFQEISIIATLTSMLMPAVRSTRMAAQRMQSSNNMKQLGLALHNFASAYGAFPATAGLDDEGKPMLSWRVAILPFIEEAELYQRFNLDEPWNSEQNLALLEEMPDVFKHPRRRTQPGQTVYQAPIGDDTLLRLSEPTRLQAITDGTSNTIMLVETTPERAVPWTAPEDYKVNWDEPSADLFVDGIAEFLFGDGSVQSISEPIDAIILKALFTRAGGEVVARP